MGWFSHMFHDVGDWFGKEWHNTEKWLPEIGLGAAAIAAPFLAPELLAGAGGLLGAGEAATAGIGADAAAAGAAAIGEGGGELGLGAADLGTASGLGATSIAAQDATLGAGGLDAIGSTGPSYLGGAGADPWAASVTPAADTPWNIGAPVGGGDVVPQGEGEILGGGNPDNIQAINQGGIDPGRLADPNWTAEVQSAPAAGGGTPTSGADVINQTFGADTANPANAMSNVMQGGAVGATPDASAAGGGGVMSKLFGADSMLGGISNTDLLKYGIPAAGLAYTLMRGRSEMPPQATDAQRIAQMEGQVGATELAAASSGQLTPPMQANIDIYTQNAINQLRQQYASTGRDWQNSTGYIQGVQQIQQQADAMREKYIEMEFNIGLKASGQATSTMMQVAQLQFQEDKQFQDSLMAAMRAMGMAFVPGGGGVNLKLA